MKGRYNFEFQVHTDEVHTFNFLSQMTLTEALLLVNEELSCYDEPPVFYFKRPIAKNKEEFVRQMENLIEDSDFDEIEYFIVETAKRNVYRRKEVNT